MTFNPDTLTSGQQLVWQLFPEMNDRAYGWWTTRLPDLFAFVDCESSFRVRVTRYEPRLDESSYGLMQILLSTARQMGFTGATLDLLQPGTNLLFGMKYAEWGWNTLQRKTHSLPTLAQWAAGYNEGYGAAARGEPDPAYTEKWLAMRRYWAGRFGA